MPVVMIDDKPVGHGEVGKHVKQLINGFHDYVNSKEWVQS